MYVIYGLFLDEKGNIYRSLTLPVFLSTTKWFSFVSNVLVCVIVDEMLIKLSLLLILFTYLTVFVVITNNNSNEIFIVLVFYYV